MSLLLLPYHRQQCFHTQLPHITGVDPVEEGAGEVISDGLVRAPGNEGANGLIMERLWADLRIHLLAQAAKEAFECGLGEDCADVIEDAAGAGQADEGVGVVEVAVAGGGGGARRHLEITGEIERLNLLVAVSKDALVVI